MSKVTGLNTGKIERKFPEWAKVDREINGLKIYNNNTFARDLAASKCNCVVATASFYMKAVKQGVLGPEALKHITRPGSGGEPITKTSVEKVDKWLRANGCKIRYYLGGGASEEGGVTLVRK